MSKEDLNEDTQPETPVSEEGVESVDNGLQQGDVELSGVSGAVDCEEDDNSSLHSMMTQNFIEYASYVIKDRAIPDIDDGLKPVQRRILHSLHSMDDGKFHKVANVIGHTMQYHPHGDASIGSALVNLANKEFFIDKQGNFGNIITGDQASAARYIECRLTPLAREVLFNKELTEFIASYDGRNREPVSLPCKVPALLMQGAEGIAVGMATKIMPHNFCELLEAQISIIKGEPFNILPDFLQGGVMDATDYQEGNGRLKVRAEIEKQKGSTKTLVVRSIPPTSTNESLIKSIEEASRKNKIKVASISDYTAENVEIEVVLQRGVNPDQAIGALYAYTECEVSISPNMVIIRNNRPEIGTVPKVLQYNTEKLVGDLRRELEFKLAKLQGLFHNKTLEQLFIEHRIYKRIEECESFDQVIDAVDAGLKPFRQMLMRDVTKEDIERLLEIRIKRISKYDMEKSRKEIDEVIQEIEAVLRNLKHLKAYTIRFIQNLLDKYGRKYPRRTKVESFVVVDVRKVALKNVKVGYDRSSGLVGSAVKSDETLACTEFDRLVLFSKKDGVCKVVPIPDKQYIGQGIEVYKAKKSQVYSMIYRDKKNDTVFAKRFRVDKYIMDKEYATVPKGCRIDKLYTNYGVVLNGEYEPNPRFKEKSFEVVFNDVSIRSTTARGFKIADKKVVKFNLTSRGTEIWPKEDGEHADNHEAEEEEAEEEEAVEVKAVPIYNKALKEMFADARVTYAEDTMPEQFKNRSNSLPEPTKVDVVKVEPTEPEVVEAVEEIMEPESVADADAKPTVVEEEVAEEEKAVDVKKEAPRRKYVEPGGGAKTTAEVAVSPPEPSAIISEPTVEDVPPQVTPEVVEDAPPVTKDVPPVIEKSQKDNGGFYREVPAEKRNPRRFLIDEDTPFSLEAD